MSMPSTTQSPFKNDRQPRSEMALRSEINRGEALIQTLEALAGPVPDSRIAVEGGASSSLFDYSRSFAQLNIPALLHELKSECKKGPFIAADIGGSYGTAARDLEEAGCDRCFVIDPAGKRDSSLTPLPPNRFIQRAAENLHGVPDECFQLILSDNTLTASPDLAKAITEIFRVLKPGGIALVEIERWSKAKDLEALRRLQLPQNTSMNLLVDDREADSIREMPLALAIETAVHASELERFEIDRGFIIRKAKSEKQ